MALSNLIISLFAGKPLLARLTASSGLAILLHHGVLRRGEWHLWAPNLLSAWLLLAAGVLAAEVALAEQGGMLASAVNAGCTVVAFTATVFASMAAYRLGFHGLRKFPGPRAAAVSKLWHSWQCRGGKNYLVLDKLRSEYGDFVRTGPNEVTIFDPEALIKLDGPGNRSIKSDWYDFLMPDMGVTTIRNKAFHDQRRKVWTLAFSAKALPWYEQQMVEHATKLESLISEAARETKPVHFGSLAYWFSFDVMGMFALAKSFNMLHDEQWHYAIVNLRRAMAILGPLSAVPWLAQIGFKFLKGYWVVKDWHSMTGWCRERMQERIKMDEEGTSIASYLIADAKSRDAVAEEHHLLTGEAIVAIVAGSDTVAPTLVFLFYQLARNPALAEKLRHELQGINPHNLEALRQLPFLNALINETLRLHPAVPTGGYRDSPPEGCTIGGRFIPGNTTIVAPRYSIFRCKSYLFLFVAPLFYFRMEASETCYRDANDFIPERWTSRPELVKDSRSFLPFAQGRYTCLGKALALSELRVVTALLVSKYRIRFPHGEVGESVERDLRDQFTAAPGNLDLVFEALG
ncbi:hypothetical protein CDD81_4037 [Ophiocordyceps australis]|uniref:Cytochrome P450 n=1 Tax=Ophiocordyceps australis TaxID=1399860 RepID=A0A2C5Y5L1_9HYPO|nr:hypothetical protein CDD81_4037 [Ophiocordyceps australis]